MRSTNYPSPLQLVGLLALAASCRLPAQVSFLPPATYPTGQSPAALAVADFDGDGRQDLAVANSGSCSVSVLLGNGDGTFRPGADFLACGFSIAVGDLNGDGRQDVVTCGRSTVEVLLGAGDGTFHPRAVYLAGDEGPYSVGVGDFTLDGIPDVVGSADGGIVLYVNPGDGRLLGRQFYRVPLGYYFYYPPDLGTLTVTDVDGDGLPDVLVGAMDIRFVYPSVIAVFFSPAFDYPTLYPTDSGLDVLLQVVAGDFNGDGAPDMATLTSASVVVLMNLENPMPIGPAGYRLHPADFDGDGNLDLAVRDADTVRILVGNGDGTFRPPAQFAAGPVTSGDQTLVAGDFNGDGKPDLATILSGDRVAVLINNSSTP